MNNKKLLRNLYKMVDYLGKEADRRSRRIDRDPHLRSNDEGLASAYEGIKFMLQRPELLETTDYDKANNVHTELPNWLKK